MGGENSKEKSDMKIKEKKFIVGSGRTINDLPFCFYITLRKNRRKKNSIS